MARDESNNLTEAAAQDWVRKITLGLIQILYCVVLGHRAAAQASKLRKDVPHPMGLLMSFCEFLNNLFVHRGLSVNEADEVRSGHRE
jgi:hypothetical protein